METNPTTAQKTGPQTLGRLLLIVVMVVAVLALVDVALRIAVPQIKILSRTIDIQSPEMLGIKLEQLRKFDGIKVVVLGDSLAFGRTMRDYGDADWQNHTLSAQIQNALEQAHPGCPIMVQNLGMNGTLPTDLDQLLRITLPEKPDLVVFDLTLRSFSREFESEKDRMSRPWLMTMDGKTPFADNWYLYRLKDTFQALAFDGQPSAYVVRKRDQLDAWLKGAKPVEQDELMLLLKAKARYDAIDLATDNPQVMGLNGALTRLRDANQLALAFYATENAEKRDELIERPRFNTLQGQLSKLMAQTKDDVTWVGPLSIYDPANYLDHVHLNTEGYSRLVKRLMPDIERKLAVSYKDKKCLSASKSD